MQWVLGMVIIERILGQGPLGWGWAGGAGPAVAGVEPETSLDFAINEGGEAGWGRGKDIVDPIALDGLELPGVVQRPVKREPGTFGPATV